MAISSKQKQKKQAKKAAKRKKIVKQKAVEQNVPRATLLARAVNNSATSPIYQCYAPENIFKEGISTMVLSRKLVSGKIALASFLVDVWEKGVTDCVYAELSEPEFNKAVQDWQSSKVPLQTSDAAYLTKVIHGAVAFAKENDNLAPHDDYNIVNKMLEHDVDVASCDLELVFGKEASLKQLRAPLAAKLRAELVANGTIAA